MATLRDGMTVNELYQLIGRLAPQSAPPSILNLVVDVLYQRYMSPYPYDIGTIARLKGITEVRVLQLETMGLTWLCCGGEEVQNMVIYYEPRLADALYG
jgi:hypothetical protein